MPELMEMLQPYLEGDKKDEFNKFLQEKGFVSKDQMSVLVEEAKKPLLNKNEELKKEKLSVKEKLEETERLGQNYQRVKEILQDFNIPVDKDGKVDYDGMEEALRGLRSTSADTPKGDPDLAQQLRRSQREHDMTKGELAKTAETVQNLEKEIQAMNGFLENVLVNQQLKSELISHDYPESVADLIILSLRDMSKAKVERIEDDEGNPLWSATTDSGQSIKEWVEWWKDTDKGMQLRMAPKMKGGNSHGSNYSNKTWSELTWDQKTELYNENPDLYRRLKNTK